MFCDWSSRLALAGVGLSLEIWTGGLAGSDRMQRCHGNLELTSCQRHDTWGQRGEGNIHPEQKYEGGGREVFHNCLVTITWRLRLCQVEAAKNCKIRIRLIALSCMRCSLAFHAGRQKIAGEGRNHIPSSSPNLSAANLAFLHRRKRYPAGNRFFINPTRSENTKQEKDTASWLLSVPCEYPSVLGRVPRIVTETLCSPEVLCSLPEFCLIH